MIRLFISYSHLDNSYRSELEKHLAMLKRQGVVDIWTDHCLAPGEDFDIRIGDAISAATVIILMVSSDFLNSDYCYSKELVRAIEQHDRGQCVVLPVIIRPCDWMAAPFSKLKVLPQDGKAISMWDSKDAAFLEVVNGLRQFSLNHNRNTATTSKVLTIDQAPKRNTRNTKSKFRLRNQDGNHTVYLAIEIDDCLDPFHFNEDDALRSINKLERIWTTETTSKESEPIFFHSTTGLAKFSGPSASEQAVCAALSISKLLEASLMRDIGDPPSARFAICHAKTYQDHRDTLYTAKLRGLLSHTRRKKGILISETALQCLPEILQQRFNPLGRFFDEIQYANANEANREKPQLYSPPSWAYILEKTEESLAFDALSAEILNSDWPPDLVLAILDPESPGGAIVGGKLVASLARYLDTPPRFQTIHIMDRGGLRLAAQPPMLDPQIHKILVVDDACFSGATFAAARHALLKAYPTVELRFAALVGNESSSAREYNVPERIYVSRLTPAGRAIFSWDRANASGSLREIVAIEYPDDFSFTTDFIVRPWGHMELFAVKKKAYVRILTIMPGHRLSRQKHTGRDEYFVALDDGLGIEVGDNAIISPKRGDYIMIPRGTLHRFSNLGIEPLRCLEVAFGDRYDEEDIERIEDDYGRAT